LEQLTENFKRGAIELRCVYDASLDPLIKEKLARISECMEKTHGEVVGKVEEMSKELKLVRTEVTEVTDEMELLKQGILFNSTKIEQTKQVIARAQAVLARLEPKEKADTSKLETLVKKSDSLQERDGADMRPARGFGLTQQVG